MRSEPDFEVSPDRPSRLVGRQGEYALLRERLDAALLGTGSLVLVSGEAGIGKTSLAAAIGQHAIGLGAIVLTGRCYDRTETAPYGLWIDLFARYARVERPSTLPSVPPAFARQDSVAAIPNQATIFHQVDDFIRAVTTTHPVVIILDDLHWSDPASLDLLRPLARMVSALPILIIAAYRSDGLPREHALNVVASLLVREADADRIVLDRLTEADLRAYVAGRFPLPDGDAAALVEYLHERTEGNPFFVTEVLHALREEGILRQEADAWALGELRAARIPLLLRQVIDAHLQRLGIEALRLLQVAAVIGHEVPLDVWQAVSETDEYTLLHLMERAVAARILEECADGRGVRFVHALFREALLDGILAARRRLWHRQIADVLLAHRTPNPHFVADHLAQAGDPRAIAWLTRAGEEAMLAFGWVTAQERFHTALDMMDAAGETESPERGWLLYRLALGLRFSNPHAAMARLDEALRIAARIDDRALRAGATFQRGSNRYLVGDVPHALAEMIAGVDLLDALTDDERSRVDRFPFTTIADCHAFLTHYLAWSGRASEAARCGEAFLQSDRRSASDAANGVAIGTAGTGLGIAYGVLGDGDAARAAFARSSDAYTRAKADLGTGFTALYTLVALAAPYLTDDAAYREAIATAGEEAWQQDNGTGYLPPPRMIRLPLLVLEGKWDEARPLAESLGARPLPATRQLGASVLGPLARAQGDTQRAQAVLHEMLPDGPATEPGTLPFIYTLPVLRLAAALALDGGDGGAARAWLETHDRWLAWNNAVLGRAEGHLAWAEYHRAAGDRRAAEQRAKDALAAATQPRQPLALLAAHRLLGELATEAQRFDDAASQLERSLALADACAAPYERALTLLAQAELRAVMGTRPEARALLDRARALTVPLGAKPLLARINALGARVAARSATHPTGLTQREIEVLRLLAAGYSNRAIGDALGMSVRTAERHLNNIYVKTNARGRIDATAFALRHGLADVPAT